MDLMINIHHWCMHQQTIHGNLFRDWSVRKVPETDNLKVEMIINVLPGIYYNNFVFDIKSHDWAHSDQYEILVNQSAIYNINNKFSEYISIIENQNLNKHADNGH